MTPQSFADARKKMGLSRNEMARLLGYATSDPHQGYRNVKRMENGQRDISPLCARLVVMVYRHWCATGNLPDFEGIA